MDKVLIKIAEMRIDEIECISINEVTANKILKLKQKLNSEDKKLLIEIDDDITVYCQNIKLQSYILGFKDRSKL